MKKLSFLVFVVLAILGCGGDTDDLPDLYCNGRRINPSVEYCFGGMVYNIYGISSSSRYSSSSVYYYPYSSSSRYSSSSVYYQYSSSSRYSSSSAASIYYGGETYQTIAIGNQIWLKRNLNYPAEGSKCGNENTSNCTTYGRLYDWATAMVVCPDGWHLPNKVEWETVIAYCGSSNMATCSFAALFGGDGLGGVGDYGRWWSSTGYEGYEEFAHNWLLYNGANTVSWYEDHKSSLFSVRCLKN